VKSIWDGMVRPSKLLRTRICLSEDHNLLSFTLFMYSSSSNSKSQRFSCISLNIPPPLRHQILDNTEVKASLFVHFPDHSFPTKHLFPFSRVTATSPFVIFKLCFSPAMREIFPHSFYSSFAIAIRALLSVINAKYCIFDPS
jgi:hypothetical protein